MDKDTISSTSETPKAKGGMGRHSNEERNISGSPSSSASSGKFLPTYLRPSTGSCHDFCKYGKKHAFEEVTKHQVRHKLGKSRDMGHKQLEKDNLNEERRKKDLIKLKSSSFRRVVTSDTPETINRLCPSLSDGDLSKEKPAKNEMLPQEETVLNEWATVPASSRNKRGQKIKEIIDDRITQAVKPSTPVCSNTSIYKSNIYTNINKQKNLLPDNASDPQRKSIAIKEKNISGLQKATALIKPRLLGQTSPKSHGTSYKPEISKRKSLTLLKNIVTAAKPGISLKAIKTSVATPRSPSTPSHGSSSTRKDGDKTSRLRDNSKMVEKVGSKPSRTTSLKVINRNSTTTENKGDVKCKQDDGKVMEKKAYVSEVKLNDAHLNFSQNKVQNTKISEEMPMPEKTSQHSLEKELLTLQNLNMHLSESEKVDSDCQQKKKSNNDQGDETDNCRKQQQTNDDQSFSPVLEDKEEFGNLHGEEAKDNQSSPSVLDSTGEGSDCNQQKIDPNHISEDDLSSQAISDNDAVTDNCLQHKSFDANQTSTDDHSASDYDNTDETDCAHRESSQSEVEYEGSESNKNEEMRPRIALVPSKDNCLSPHKLKFRRGKVIEPQPDGNGPKRLRFRRARVISDGGGGTYRRRHLRNSEMDYVLPDDLNPQAETIVLRHKDLQEKKGSQGLFNNVIEETASKLVETRKSKVKALVGAVETVISLQDGRPTSTT